MRFYVATLLACLCGWVNAQRSDINGFIRSKHNENLPNTSVLLQSISDKKFHPQHTESDSAGYYRFSKLPGGKYMLTATHVGYLKTSGGIILISMATAYLPVTLCWKKTVLRSKK